MANDKDSDDDSSDGHLVAIARAVAQSELDKLESEVISALKAQKPAGHFATGSQLSPSFSRPVRAQAVRLPMNRTAGGILLARLENTARNAAKLAVGHDSRETSRGNKKPACLGNIRVLRG